MQVLLEIDANMAAMIVQRRQGVCDEYCVMVLRVVMIVIIWLWCVMDDEDLVRMMTVMAVIIIWYTEYKC